MCDVRDKIAGTILGTAVGDALGLPFEGMSRRRAERIRRGKPLRHRFILGRGMVSDDTEHTCLVGQALLRAPDDPDRFARSLAWGLRWWLLSLSSAIGRATLRAVLKLWVGFPPSRSGVYSAGNGPAMRGALLGVCLGSDPDRLRAYVRASTRLTHIDPRAERGAFLVALAAHFGATQGPARTSPESFLRLARTNLAELDAELAALLDMVEDHLKQDSPASALAGALGLQRGVTGYVYHTVALALYCWLRSPGDFRRAMEEVIALGGDTDTTGAVVGGIAGATVGPGGIPADWMRGLIEWPRSVQWMRALANRLAEQFSGEATRSQRGPPALFWPGLIPRNLLFLVALLVHAFRRLLPPY